jgi:glycolate oxidase
MPAGPDPFAFRGVLVERFGADRVATAPEDRRLLSADASRRYSDCVAAVFPDREEDVVALVFAAKELGFSIVPRGAGTSPTGSAEAGPSQVVVDFSRMNRILDLSARDLVAIVEPGVLCGALQERCEKEGLFYPPDPASSRVSTLGGNVATGAGGLRAVKYGVTRDYVLGMRVVVGDGSVLDLGGRSLKSVVGYDLVRLFVGSEGTLGLTTRLTLKLLPKPPSAAAIEASFRDEAGAYRGADAILARGLLPRALEAMDGEISAIAARAVGLDLPAGVGSKLLVEVDGDEETCARDVDRVEAALVDAGAFETRRAVSPAERDILWRARRSVSSGVYRAYPAKTSEDFGVPRGSLAEAIAAMKEAGAKRGVKVLAYGHAGDANLHVNFVYDPADPTAKERVRDAVRAAADVCLAFGGTTSGEHGVGLKKLDAARRELDPAALRYMGGIKRLFDPAGIFNPKKAIPPT